MKYIVAVMALVTLTACSTKDEQYYRLNPRALQEAIRECPAKQPAKVSCDQLLDIDKTVKELAFQLQMGPQRFGKTILSLQQTLAQQEIELKNNPDQPQLKDAIENNKQMLAEHLAIVKWLESPE